MMKKRVLALLFTVCVIIPMISGCGAVSKVSEVSSIAEDLKDVSQFVQIMVNASDENYQPSQEAIEQYEKVVEEVLSLETQVESYVEDSYTTKEFWELFNDKLEELYQADLAAGNDVVPTRMADTPDGLELAYDLTIPLAREICDPSEDDEGLISFLATDFYYCYEDYFIELLEEKPGYVTYDVYVIYRDLE